MGNYASQAIAAGLPDYGWEAVEKIYRARYEHDGCPWDAPLQWSGKGNLEPQWGRWYMSHPASWHLLWALAGARLDRLHGSLTLEPCWPSGWGDELRSLPIFFPGLWAEVSSRRSADHQEVALTVKRVLSPIVLTKAGIRLPPYLSDVDVRASVIGEPGRTATRRERLVTFDAPLTLARAGDGFTMTAARRPSRRANAESAEPQPLSLER